MLLRVKFLSLFALAGFLLFLLLRNHWQEDSLDLSFSNTVNVTEGSHNGTCQCSCELQHEPEVMEWDSSRVLRGSPAERFRGMLLHQHLMIQRAQIVLDNLRNDTRYLTTCAAAGFSMNLSLFNQI